MTNGYIDWNCHLLTGGHEFMTSVDHAADALTYLHDMRGFDVFCMMPYFSPSAESVSQFLIRRDRSTQRLLQAFADNSYKPDLMLGASIPLEPELHLIEHLSKLTFQFNDRKYLPISLPISDFEDWIDFEINRLLYRAGFHLMFLSFDLACLFYPKDNIEKFMRISNAIFQFHYRSLEDPRICSVISKMIQNNITVLLGTSLDRSEKAYRYDVDFYLKNAEEHLSSAEYAILMKYNRHLPKKHAPLLKLS